MNEIKIPVKVEKKTREFTIQGKTFIGYSYDTPTTPEEAWELLKLERQLRSQEGGYQVGDKWYHSDSQSKIQQMGLVLLGTNIPAGLMWKTMDGSYVEMTPQLAQGIFGTAAQKDTQIFSTAEIKRSQITPETNLETFDYFGGWPTAFWELT